MGNFGDDVILRSIVFQLRLRVKDVSITVLSDRPDVVRKEMGLKSVGRTPNLTDSLKRIFEISRADLFILGGGGLLMDWADSDSYVERWLGDMRISQELHVPNMTAGIGVGKVWTETSKKSIREVLSKADKICVRDSDSAATLSALGVKSNVVTTSDLALIVPELDKQRKESSRTRRNDVGNPLVLVCLRHWYVYRNQNVDEIIFNRMKSSISQALSELVSTRNASVKFVPFMTSKKEDDRQVGREVSSLMHDVSSRTLELDHVPSISEFLNLLDQSSFLIGMRLHSIIVATAANVPCIGINYDDKVHRFMNSVGLTDWCLNPEEVTSEKISFLAERALSPEFESAKPGPMEKSVAAALENINVAVQLLQKEASSSSRMHKMRRLPELASIMIKLAAQRIRSQNSHQSSTRVGRHSHKLNESSAKAVPSTQQQAA